MLYKLIIRSVLIFILITIFTYLNATEDKEPSVEEIEKLLQLRSRTSSLFIKSKLDAYINEVDMSQYSDLEKAQIYELIFYRDSEQNQVDKSGELEGLKPTLADLKFMIQEEQIHKIPLVQRLLISTIVALDVSEMSPSEVYDFAEVTKTIQNPQFAQHAVRKFASAIFSYSLTLPYPPKNTKEGRKHKDYVIAKSAAISDALAIIARASDDIVIRLDAVRISIFSVNRLYASLGETGIIYGVENFLECLNIFLDKNDPVNVNNMSVHLKAQVAFIQLVSNMLLSNMFDRELLPFLLNALEKVAQETEFKEVKTIISRVLLLSVHLFRIEYGEGNPLSDKALLTRAKLDEAYSVRAFSDQDLRNKGSDISLDSIFMQADIADHEISLETRLAERLEPDTRSLDDMLRGMSEGRSVEELIKARIKDSENRTGRSKPGKVR
ncbi:MAG: hypothetical protein ABIA04_16395 [Pseudomonadota bacterium]